MYQTFVLGLGALLIVGIGYFIKHTDQAGVITSQLSVKESSMSAEQMKTVLPGTYVCDTDARCVHPRVLTLTADGNVKMVTTFNSDVETLEETGTWNIDPAGRLSITLEASQATTYPTPFQLTAKYVSERTIIGGEGSGYENWANAIFKKQQEDTDPEATQPNQ